MRPQGISIGRWTDAAEVLAFTGMGIFNKKFVEIVDRISYDRPQSRYCCPLFSPSGIRPEGGSPMPLSVSQLIASADTSGDALRLIRAAMNLTQADIVARAEGAIGADQISLIERGKRPMTSKQCTVIARALDADRCRRGAAHADGPDRPRTRAPETHYCARSGSGVRLSTVEAFVMAYPRRRWRRSSPPWMRWRRCGPTSKRGDCPLRMPAHAGPQTQ